MDGRWGCCSCARVVDELDEAPAVVVEDAAADVGGAEGSEEDCDRADATEAADREGPSLEATIADLSRNFLYSYLASKRDEDVGHRCQQEENLHRIYCSSSLSRSASI